jgi:hypothetical protein
MNKSNFDKNNQRDESQTEEIKGKVEYGIFSGPGMVNKLVPFIEVDGYAITEGDIVLGTVEELRNPDPKVLEQNEEERVRDGDTGERGLVIAGSQFRWPNKTMPYEIDPNLPNQSRVQQAMEHITSKTGFTFVKRTNQADYVRFRWHPSSANSQLGKRGGEQIINLADWAAVGNTIHEMLHAMGVYHEQGRSDRDDYIRIHWTNLEDGWASQYAQPVGALSIATYDYCSIMHYSQTGGAKPGLNAFTVLKPTSCTVGQRQVMSEKDISTVKSIYPQQTTQFPTIRRGSTDPSVKILQQCLVKLGYSIGSAGIDGIFGSATDAAVRQFQRDRGLVVDGIVGPLTWGKINEACP